MTLTEIQQKVHESHQHIEKYESEEVKGFLHQVIAELETSLERQWAVMNDLNVIAESPDINQDAAKLIGFIRDNIAENFGEKGRFKKI